jgi:pimeloyl-ACP methyl ester carboxylesterase
MPTKYVEVKGCATYYYYVGATTLPDVTPDFSRGRKIVLIHAAGSNGNSWHHQLDHLGAKHSPIAMDLPAHGRSDGVEGLRSISEYADFVIAFMQALQIRSAVIAGRSMGGAVAMDLAIRHPNSVQALVLIATAAKFNIPPDRIGGLRDVTQGRAPQAFTTDGYSPKTVSQNFDVVREGWMEQIKTDPRVRYTDMVACAEADLRAELGTIRVPSLVIAGADDTGTTVADAEIIAKGISGARMETMVDAGHNIPTEKPRELNELIGTFLDKLR